VVSEAPSFRIALSGRELRCNPISRGIFLVADKSPGTICCEEEPFFLFIMNYLSNNLQQALAILGDLWIEPTTLIKQPRTRRAEAPEFSILDCSGLRKQMYTNLTIHFIRIRTRRNPMVSKYLFSSFSAIPHLLMTRSRRRLLPLEQDQKKENLFGLCVSDIRVDWRTTHLVKKRV
jgi:hypothetical protein